MWHADKPNDLAADTCAVLNGGRLGDTMCSRSYPMICEDDAWPTW